MGDKVTVFVGDRFGSIDVADFHFASIEWQGDRATVYGWYQLGDRMIFLKADVAAEVLAEFGLGGLVYSVY